ncbi:DUF371 domain-containing protein [Halococcus sp. AFM35]|uniref:DUF371 domain-containing protein n=1 Tax=Halococcus sp. AFM35 TaxID=3421653 RepID=UPI003EC0CE68
MEEVVRARGHENVSARHASTLELTSDEYLTPTGDCILGIEADRTPAEFGTGFVETCRDGNATISLTLDAGDHTEIVTGRGHPELTFENERSLVCRTSEYVDDRTVMVDADKAAADLDRAFVDALAEGAELTGTLRVD